MTPFFLSYWSKGTIKAAWEAKRDGQVSKTRVIIYWYVYLPSEIPFEWVVSTLTLVLIIKGIKGFQTQYCFLAHKFHKVHMKGKICGWWQKDHLVWGNTFWDNDVSEFWPSHGFIWGRQVFSRWYVVAPFAVTSLCSKVPEAVFVRASDEANVLFKFVFC